MKAAPAAIFAAASGVLVLAAIVAGIVVTGSPSAVRAQRLDDQRVRDLQAIVSTIERYRRTHTNVPVSLAGLRDEDPQAHVRLEDPETRTPYEYRVTGPSSYELCAGFASALDEREAGERRIPVFWQHPAGRHCFAFEAKPPVQR